MEYQFYVYILSNTYHTVFYVGVTNNIYRRIGEHRSGAIEGFTKKYKVHKLLYFEMYQYIDQAILREKHLKKWSRLWKLKLIKETNPNLHDIYADLVW